MKHKKKQKHKKKPKQTLTELELLQRDCAKWLWDLVSDIDWGHATISSPKDIPRNSQWHLQGAMKIRLINYDRSKKGLPSVKEVYVDVNTNPKPYKGWITLPLYRIHSHLQGLETIYYGSNPSLKKALIMLDFDWHEGAVEQHGADSDAMDAARFVRDVLFSAEQMYIEPSTGGLGAHAYLLVDCGKGSPESLEEDLQALKPIVQRIIDLEGYKCNFCGFYGNFTIFKGWTIPKGGMSRLAKLPRPSTADQFRALLSLQSIPVNAMRMRFDSVVLPLICDDFGFSSGYAQKLIVAEGSSTTASQNTPASSESLPPPLGASSTAGIQQQSVHCEDILSSKGGETVTIAAIQGLANPNKRMFQATYLLARQLQRCPTVEETLAFYEGNGLNTGPDVKGRRSARASDAVESCKATFKTAQRLGVRRYMGLIERLVTDEAMKAVKYARKLRREDIAVALYVATKRLTSKQANPRYQRTVGQRFMVAAFRNLKEAGLTTRSMDSKKWAAVKKVLLGSGLIGRVAGSSTGLSEQFVLGPNHPLHGRDFFSAQKKGGVQTPPVEFNN